MPKRDYMKLKLSLVEARGEADLLQMHQCGCTCEGNVLSGHFRQTLQTFSKHPIQGKYGKKEGKKARQTCL